MGAAGVTAGAAVVGAGASAYGSLSKNSGGSSSTTGATTNGPWAPQQPYIANGLNSAQTVYDNRLQQGPYTGEMVAGGNPLTTQAGIYAGNFSNGEGSDIVNGMGTTAGTLNTAAAPYVSNAQGIATNGITGPGVSGLQGTLSNYGTGQQTVQGANPALSGALNNAAVSGANGLQGFQDTLSTAANQGLSDPTQQIENSAQTYANSPQTQAALTATNTAINQTLNQSTLPTQNQQEAQAGALNSSRSGMAEGMARQAAATSEGQADAAIQNNAYNTGMSTASGLYSSGLNTATNAGMYGYNDLANNANTQAGQQIGLNETNAANELNAANSGLNFANANTNAQLSGNAQLGNATGMGVSAGTAALNGASTNYNLAASGGLLDQSMQQAGDTNAYDLYNQSNQYGQNILSDYMGIVGHAYGQQGTQQGAQQTQLPANPIGAGVGGALAGASLYNQSGSGGSSLFSGNGALSANSLNSTFGTQFGAGTFPTASNPNAVVPGYQANGYTPLY